MSHADWSLKISGTQYAWSEPPLFGFFPTAKVLYSIGSDMRINFLVPYVVILYNIYVQYKYGISTLQEVVTTGHVPSVNCLC